jgi:glycosyltransferase involved in cell wall biosynthesis
MARGAQILRIEYQASENAGWVEFIDGKPHEELGELFARARVHPLPSWFETTGLASLDAGLSGCSVVSTDRGHAKEYLGDRATDCDPADIRSIRAAVELAWNEEPSPDLRNYLLDHFTWDHVARATADAYGTVLDQRRDPVVAGSHGSY